MKQSRDVLMRKRTILINLSNIYIYIHTFTFYKYSTHIKIWHSKLHYAVDKNWNKKIKKIIFACEFSVKINRK